MKITKKQIREIVRGEIKSIVNEASVSGEEFVAMWEKALKIAKSAKMWSPHMKVKDSAAAVGYTNSDFWDKVPDRYDSMPVFGYHRQSAEKAFKYGDWTRPLMIGWGITDAENDAEMKKGGKNIVNVLKRAGFKVNWSGNPDKKIELIPG